MVLLVVDTQKLITTEDLYNFNEFENTVKILIAAARENSVEVIYVRHDDGAGEKLTKGTPGFEIYDSFCPEPGEKIFVKMVNSSFKGTGLLEYLKDKNVKTIAVVGLQTDYCIDATIKCGFEHGFKMIMRIMIFIEGTTFYTKPLLFLVTKYGYTPIGNAVKIVNTLYEKGHEIYLCSYVRRARYNFIKSIVDFYGMRYTEILCRDKGELYSTVVEQIKPDVLIEDDCKSIGGLKKCCITNVREEIKQDIQSVIVPEFAGIDDIVID